MKFASIQTKGEDEIQCSMEPLVVDCAKSKRHRVVQTDRQTERQAACMSVESVWGSSLLYPVLLVCSIAERRRRSLFTVAQCVLLLVVDTELDRAKHDRLVQRPCCSCGCWHSRLTVDCLVWTIAHRLHTRTTHAWQLTTTLTSGLDG